VQQKGRGKKRRECISKISRSGKRNLKHIFSQKKKKRLATKEGGPAVGAMVREAEKKKPFCGRGEKKKKKADAIHSGEKEGSETH